MSPVIYSDVLHSAKLASWINSLGEIKGRHTQEDWSLPLVPSRVYTKRLVAGLVPQAFHTKRLEEQVVGTCPKNLNQFEFVGLVAGTKF